MDNLNLTIEEYIMLEEEKTRKHEKVFNWQTATYEKIRVDDDFYDLRSMEAEFAAIVVNDDFVPQDTLQCKSQVSVRVNDEINFCISFDESDDEDYTIIYMALPSREQSHQFLRYKGLEYTYLDIADFESRMAMEHRDEAGVVVFTSEAWRRFFDTRGLLVWELILEFLSTLIFGEVLLDFDAPGTIQYWSKSERMIPRKRDLHDYWRDILTAGDFLGPPPSYTLIKDLVLRLCHKMMAHSIAGRSQAPKKVTVTDLFYQRGLDVRSFVARLAKHFRLLTAEILRGLMVIDPKLQINDMAELDALIIDEVSQAILAPVQAPQQPPLPPPAPARTIPQRMAKLEEDVYEIRRALTKQHEVIDVMACDFLGLVPPDPAQATCSNGWARHEGAMCTDTWEHCTEQYEVIDVMACDFLGLVHRLSLA
ncbi:hypothetical protein Tco_0631434 [Tanacetum coccineum]